MRELKHVTDLSLMQIALLYAAPYDAPLLMVGVRGSIKKAVDELIGSGLLERNHSTASDVYCVRLTVAGHEDYLEAMRRLRAHDAGR